MKKLQTRKQQRGKVIMREARKNIITDITKKPRKIPSVKAQANPYKK